MFQYAFGQDAFNTSAAVCDPLDARGAEIAHEALLVRMQAERSQGALGGSKNNVGALTHP